MYYEKVSQKYVKNIIRQQNIREKNSLGEGKKKLCRISVENERRGSQRCVQILWEFKRTESCTKSCKLNREVWNSVSVLLE